MDMNHAPNPGEREGKGETPRRPPRGPEVPSPPTAVAALKSEVLELRRRLEEAEETIRAIRDGEVDAFVVTGDESETDRVFTLESAEHPYRRYVEAMHQAAVTVTVDGTVLYANGAFARAVARSPESLVGSSMESFVAAPQRDLVAAVIAGRLEGRCELTLVRGDGTHVPVMLATAGPVESREIVCLVLTDLTERRRLEETIAAETLSRSMLEQAVDAIVVGDVTGTLIRAGAAARRLCGRDPVGMALEAAFRLRPRDGLEEPRPFCRAVLGRVLAGETVHGAEALFDRADGRHFDLLVGAGPLRDDAGRVVGFVATLTDITTLREAEESLRKADRRKDEFLAMLGHELRNPLSAISNAAQVARRVRAEEPRNWSIQVIERQIHQLSHLVDDLLDISRISRGKIQLRRELLDARSSIDRATQVVQPLVTERRHQLVVPPLTESLPILADPARLEQILVNLLNNAAKYTDPGGQITLTAEIRADRLGLAVQDTGIGIAPEKLPVIFDLFEQVDDSLARTRGGLGVGLTLVKTLTELHGGSVTVESPGLGLGSTFRVELPLACNPVPTADPSEDSHLPAAPDGDRVLIVDDNVDSAEGMAMLLRQRGFAVLMAHDGPDALRLASAFRPAFVLLDIGLPGMDGFELAGAFRSDPTHREAVVIAVTGYGKEADRARSRESGIDHHLVKPVALDVLLPLLAGGKKTATTTTR